MKNDINNLGSLDYITEFESSEKLSKILENIHKSLSFGPKPHLINSLVFSCFLQTSTSLQNIKGGYFCHIPVKRFQKLCKFGVTCSYDELKRLRTSLARYSSKNVHPIDLPLNDSIVQIIVNNFDLDISSPNGKTQTHSLGMIDTKNESSQDEAMKISKIPRIHHTERSDTIDYTVDVQR